MTELEKIAYAKSFIDKLANGINPLDGAPIPEQDIVNNVRLSRCFFFVSDILRTIIENGGIHPKKEPKPRKQAFTLTNEERQKISVSEIPLSISEIAGHLNTLIDSETTKKLSNTTLNKWLLGLQLLETVTLPNGATRKMPTEQGRALGIFTEERIGQYGPYLSVLYSPSAQQFIYDNIDSVIDFKSDSEPRTEGYGRPWTEEQNEHLKALFREGVPVREIAATMKRTEGGIRARLKKLGLIENKWDAK